MLKVNVKSVNLKHFCAQKKAVIPVTAYVFCLIYLTIMPTMLLTSPAPMMSTISPASATEEM